MRPGDPYSEGTNEELKTWVPTRVWHNRTILWRIPSAPRKLEEGETLTPAPPHQPSDASEQQDNLNLKRFTQLVPFWGQSLAMAAPWSIELNQNIFLLIQHHLHRDTLPISRELYESFRRQNNIWKPCICTMQAPSAIRLFPAASHTSLKLSPTMVATLCSSNNLAGSGSDFTVG